MSEHPNTALLRGLYRRDPATLGSLIATSFDESFVCHAAGPAPVGGELVGIEAMLAHLGELDRRCGDTLRATPLDFLVDDTWAVVPQVMTATRGGRTLDMPVAGFWRFSGPERLAEHWEAPSDIRAWNAFWGD